MSSPTRRASHANCFCIGKSGNHNGRFHFEKRKTRTILSIEECRLLLAFIISATSFISNIFTFQQLMIIIIEISLLCKTLNEITILIIPLNDIANIYALTCHFLLFCLRYKFRTVYACVSITCGTMCNAQVNNHN